MHCHSPAGRRNPPFVLETPPFRSREDSRIRTLVPMTRTMAALEPAFFIGLGLVAVWLYLRFPRLRPSSVTGAAGHVAVSFLLFNLAPYGLHLCVRMLPVPISLVAFTVGVLIPTLGYVLLSWVWLIARIHDLGSPKPRGGHRVRSSTAA